MTAAIVVQGVGKAFKRYPSQWARAREWLFRIPSHELLWVLRDVSFEVPAGAALGIVGANGAGKSTLLKIIARATTSSEGSVTSSGRVAALLELGMGFHPEFTGRQNVMMAGQLIGLSLAEVEVLSVTSSALPISVISWTSRCELSRAACRCALPLVWRLQ